MRRCRVAGMSAMGGKQTLSHSRRAPSLNLSYIGRMTESCGVGGIPSGMIATGRLSWFNSQKQFGFVKLADRLGDAFLHIAVLKEGGFYFLPRGTTMQVRVEPDRGKHRVIEVLTVDTSTAQHGEPPPLVRKPKEPSG